MKRSVLIVLLISVFFASCSTITQNTAEKITLPTSITAHLQGNDALFTADITETEAKIVFDPQHSLSGTTLYFAPDGNAAVCGEYTRDFKSGIFPAQEAFIKALRILAMQEKIEDGGKYTIDEMTVMVYYDKDNDRLTGLETEESGRNFVFSIVSLEPYEAQSDS